MSLLTQFVGASGGGGIKSVQKGTVWATPTVGTGFDLAYVDVIIAAVDVSKTFLLIDVGFGSTISYATYKSGSALSYIGIGRLLNSTTLRISCQSSMNPTAAVGTWQVIEGQ